MTDAPSDWEMALRIGKAAGQVVRGLKENAPKKAMWGLSLVQMWDLTGRVDEVPDLGIVCTTTVGFPGSTALRYVGMNIMGGGVGTLEDNGTTRTVIVFPNMLRVAANGKQIKAHGFLHHELAHILYSHDPDELYRMARTARGVGEADRLGLTANQRKRVQELYAAMTAETVPLGERLIAQETDLDHQFARKTVTPASLQAATAEIAATQAALRFAHLRHHLSTLEVLTSEQVRLYADLRGYGPAGGHAHGAKGHH